MVILGIWAIILCSSSKRNPPKGGNRTPQAGDFFLRINIISRSPERVNGFPPFGGLILTTFCPKINSSENNATETTIQPIRTEQGEKS
jgi:hypothetical protein